MVARLPTEDGRTQIRRLLGVDELRAGFLAHTRAAFARLGTPPRRVLDLGCGSGAVTLELARLCSATVIGLDPDVAAVAEANRAIAAGGLGARVSARVGSLFDRDLDGGSFDLIWEEGVLHLLDPERSLPACQRLLTGDGRLVMHEAHTWFASLRARLAAFGLALVDELALPARSWWTDYYAPLRQRLHERRGALPGGADAAAEIAQLEREIALVEPAPERFDCGFFILARRATLP